MQATKERQATKEMFTRDLQHGASKPDQAWIFIGRLW